MSFVGDKRKAVFIPFADVTMQWDKYTSDVAAGLPDLSVTGVHTSEDMVQAILQAEVVMIGGGNTFHLLKLLQDKKLLSAIRESINNGALYVGWSAGSVVACPDISTTNDMPIVWPGEAGALAFLDFHVNAHYNNFAPPGYQGETRDDRLNEAMLVGDKITILALSEGCALLGEDHSLFILKSPASERPAGSKLQVKVWVLKDRKEKKFQVVDIPTGQAEDKFALEPYLPLL